MMMMVRPTKRVLLECIEVKERGCLERENLYYITAYFA
jgi:hypothetical protein